MRSSETSSICEVTYFAERDIDVWLAEELRVNSTFARWFAGRANFTEDVECPAQRCSVSVMGENGETDVEAIFKSVSGRTFALLVENKIEHSISVNQIARYLDRGKYGMGYGFWDQFSIIIFAPAAKLAKYADVIGQTPRASFEEAAQFLSTTGTDARTQYRSVFLARAAMEKNLEVDGADAFRVSFWKSVYEMLDKKYPGYFSLDRTAYPRTTYFAANCVDAPGYFRVDLKGHMGEVDLAFKNSNAGQLLNFLEANKPEFARIVFNKRSIALQIKDLPKFFVGDGAATVETHALKSFEAAHMLLEFWKANRVFFDSHYGA